MTEANWALAAAIDQIEPHLKRIADALEKLADTAEHSDEVAERAAALDEWRYGRGKHPDD